MDLQEIEAEYRDVRRPVLESLGGLLHSLLSALLNSASIDVGQIEHRVKTVESFVGKIERKAYDKPFEETKDLLGLRVITYYNDDVHRVSELDATCCFPPA